MARLGFSRDVRGPRCKALPARLRASAPKDASIRALDEPLVVPTDQGVVPLEDQAVRAPICAASSISAFRHAARAASSSLPRSAV